MRWIIAAASAVALSAVLALQSMVCSGESPGQKGAAAKRTRSGEAGPAEYNPARLVCWAANRRIDESSGLAASRTTPGVFWTHNDSGDRARLYAFDLKGNSLGTFAIKAGHRDWEDMCAYKAGGKGYLVVADTGDNARRRKSYAIYVCSEPKFKPDGDKEPLKAVGAPKVVESFAFTYGDGNSHDGESIAASPDGRTLYIVTRNRNGKRCKAFRLERYADGKGNGLKESVVAEEIAVLQYRDVSALDISGDGLRMMVHTYGDGYEFRRKPKESWKQALKRKPRRVVFPKLSPRVKGEGCSYGFDDVTLYLTSEHFRGCPLFVVSPKKK